MDILETKFSMLPECYMRVADRFFILAICLNLTKFKHALDWSSFNNLVTSICLNQLPFEQAIL